MSDLEKFYQLGINILNDDNKNLKYRNGKLKTITVNQGKDKIILNLYEPIRLDFYSFIKDEFTVYIHEDDPSNIDVLIDYLKKYEFRSNLIEGIE